QWARFFESHDVVLCPPSAVLAFPHDALPDVHARVLDIDGATAPYLDLLKWGSLATGADLPAAVAPVRRSSAGLPGGVQVTAPPGVRRSCAPLRSPGSIGPSATSLSGSTTVALLLTKTTTCRRSASEAAAHCLSWP